jgi:hypothetical protein
MVTRVNCPNCTKITLMSAPSDRCARCGAELQAAFTAAQPSLALQAPAARPAPVRPAVTLQPPAQSRLRPSLADSDAGWARVRSGLHGLHLLATLAFIVDVLSIALLVKGVLWGVEVAEAGGTNSSTNVALLIGVLGAALIATVVLAVLGLAAAIYTAVCTVRLRAAPDRGLVAAANGMLAAFAVTGGAVLLDIFVNTRVLDWVAPITAFAGAAAFSVYLFRLAKRVDVSMLVPGVAAVLLMAPVLLDPIGGVLAPAFFVTLAFKPGLALAVQGGAAAIGLLGALVYRAQIKTLADALDAPRFVAAPSSRPQPGAQRTALVA